MSASSTAPATSAMPAITPMRDPSPGPKKETARITVLPDPPAKPAPTVQMKKTQPLITMPAPQTQKAPITVASTASTAPQLPPLVPKNIVTTDFFGMLDFVPMPLCWTLLATSAGVLLIQIWGYFA
jgi:hypothetical protein